MTLTVAVASTLTFVMCGYYALSYRRRESASRSIMESAQAAGLVEPPSLHPVIDETLCIGCGGCTEACPEGKVLGLIDGRAKLIEPSQCIGHGACKQACPADAIELVFGTATRGVDLPRVNPDFETNVPGIFIAGELGGMGLIRNAVEQGRQAIESIGRLPGLGDPNRLDLLIVGAGPAGISASLAAMERGLRFVTVEQDTLGGTVSHFPRGKIVMTAPARLAMVGQMKFTETRKEALLEFWNSVVQRTGLEVRECERVEEVAANGAGFEVRTTRARYRTRSVLLAIGRRGTPRKLGVPGEELPKVVYRLTDPEQYRGRKVLVVGGGDSALEAAASVAEEPGTTVTLSYRAEAFGRAKLKNRARVDALAQAGRLELLFRSNVTAIRQDRVTLERDGGTLDRPNDDVIVCAGGILPTRFLRKVGIEIDTKYGTT